jgi:hypothetical protein
MRPDAVITVQSWLEYSRVSAQCDFAHWAPIWRRLEQVQTTVIEESTMKIALRVVGGLLPLVGPIWFLQGANVLTAGSSPMIGDTRWEFYGGLAVLIGAALLVVSWRKTSSSSL